MLSLGLAVGGICFEIAQTAAAKAAESVAVIQQPVVMTTTPEVDIIDERIDLGGFALNILCDADTHASFDCDESGGETLSRLVYERNTLICEETGMTIAAVPSEDVYNDAYSDIISGEYKYNLYSANADSLVPLLTNGLLHNVSGSKYINTAAPYFDGATMEALSINGGQYLISSAAADAHMNSYVIAYDRGKAEDLGIDVSTEAFTVSKLLEYCRAAYKEDEESKSYGLYLDKEDVYPLCFGVGISFVKTSSGSVSAYPLDKLKVQLGELGKLISESGAVLYDSDADEKDAVFFVKTLSEIDELRAGGMDVGILPLPLLADTDSHKTYIDLSGAPLSAIPNGVPEADKAEYALSLIAEFSLGKVDAYFKDEISLGNEDDKKTLDIIFADTSNDLSSLLGYGEIGMLLADAASGKEDRFEYEYYNRRALYEKAISIIEKRIAANK